MRYAIMNTKISGALDGLDEDAVHASLAPGVHHLRQSAKAFAAQSSLHVSTATVYNISSTDVGGGVAELIPSFCRIVHSLGGSMKWVILTPEESQKASFFAFTKRIHNCTHGEGVPFATTGNDATAFQEYMKVCEKNATDLIELFSSPVTEVAPSSARASNTTSSSSASALAPPEASQHIVILHDPQTLGMAKFLRERLPRLVIIYRSHIGLDGADTEVTASVWRLLEPLISKCCCRMVVSCHEYVRSSLAFKTAIIAPGLTPLSSKNRDMTMYSIIQILLRVGLLPNFLKGPGCDLVEAPFDEQAIIILPPHLREAATTASPRGGEGPPLPAEEGEAGLLASLTSSGRTSKANFLWESPLSETTPLESASAAAPPASDEIVCATPWHSVPFIGRPILTQISRFDKLKGFIELMRGWVHLKKHAESYASSAPDESVTTAADRKDHVVELHLAMIRAAVLVLVGPSPAGVTDDPEAVTVLTSIIKEYDSLPQHLQRNIRIVILPVKDIDSNALVVNAIQRASFAVIQNSLREGFGLTLAEALYKGTLAIGTRKAVGLRTQIRHGVDGILVDRPDDVRDVAAALSLALGYPKMRDRLAANGQARLINSFLVYSSIEAWQKLFFETTATS